MRHDWEVTPQVASPSYLDHAADGDGDVRTYRRVSLVAGLVWGISSLALLKLVIWGTIEVARTSDPEGLLEAAATTDHAPWPWLGFLAALIGFIPIAILLPWAIHRYHRRSWRTSVTPYLTINPRQLATGAALFGALYLLVAGATALLLSGSITVRFDWGEFLPGLLVLVALLWVQAFGQELLFRGYNMQWAWLDVRSPGVLATISGISFAVPFLFAPYIVQWVVPEIEVPDSSWPERLVLMVGYAIIGAAFALASIRTGTVELAMGAAFSFSLLTALLLAPRSGQLAGGSVLELQSGTGTSTVYVALLGVACLIFATVSRRLVPDPTGRPLLRDASTASVLAMPAGSPIWRVSVRGLLAHKVRLLLTLVTIALGVTFVTATLVFADTTTRALDLFFDQEPADVVVQPVDPITAFANPGRPPSLSFSEDDAATVSRVAGVMSVAPSVNQEGVLVLDPVTGEPVGGPSASHIGASWTAEQLPAGAADLVSDLPRGLGQVALDATTAERLGLQPGDPVRLITPLEPDATRQWTLTGTIDIGLAGGATVAVFDLPTAQRLITGAGRVNQLLVTASQDPATVAARMNEALGPDSGLTAITGREAADRAAAEVADGIGFLNTLLTVFAVLSVVAGLFLIVNTFAMLVSQRSRELALLRAVGATTEQLQVGVIVQATLVGIVGTIIGLALGLYLAVGIRRGLRIAGIDVPGGSLVVAPRTLAIAAVVGVGATILAAWVPALRAGRTPPVEGLRSGRRLTREAVIRRLAIAGICVALAVTTAMVALRDSLAENAVAWMGLSAVLALAGFVAASPWLVRPVMALITVPLRGAVGRLAAANSARNPRRVTATTSALALGVALIGIITVLTTSATATADREISRTFASDLSIGEPPLYRPYDHSLTTRAARVPGVSSHTYIRTTSGQRREIPVPVFGVQPDLITQAVNVTATDGHLSRVGGDVIALDSRLAARYGLTVGDDFTADYRTGPRTFRIGAVFEPVLVFEGILTDLATAEELGAAPGLDTAAYFTVTEDADIGQVQQGIREAISANPALQVQDTDTLKANFADQVRQLLGFVFAMLALAVIIAVLSIVNTLLLSVQERTSEIGMLRAIGATRAQVRTMVVLEAAVLGLFGATCGVILGVGYGILMRLVMEPLGITHLALPWGWLAACVVGGTLAGMGAAIWPASTAARADPLEAISTD